MSTKYQRRDVQREMDARNWMGCQGVSIIDSTDTSEEIARRKRLFGFEDEDPITRALADIGTSIMAAAATCSDDDDVGVVVSVNSSDFQDYGSMIADIMSASNLYELQEIAEFYREMPGAEQLAEACAAELTGRKLRRVG